MKDNIPKTVDEAFKSLKIGQRTEYIHDTIKAGTIVFVDGKEETKQHLYQLMMDVINEGNNWKLPRVVGKTIARQRTKLNELFNHE